MWDALIGAGASLAGGLLGGSPSTPKFRPSDVITGMGTADWDKKGKVLNTTLSPEQQAFADRYNEMAMSYLNGGSSTAGFQQWASGLGGMFPGLFSGAMDASQVDPSALNAYTANMGGLAGQMQGAFSGANLAGMNILGGAAPGSAEANSMFGLGQSMMGRNYNDVFNQRLGLLREQAQPFEDRAANSFLSRQYAMGRMGSTGGGRDTEAFARGLAQADTTRQLDAMNLSESLYGRDQAMGAGLMGTGLQGLLSGFQSQTGAAQGLLGLGGSLGSTLGNIYGAGYGAQTAYGDLVNSRAQQRMSNASTLFGFGNQLGQQDLTNAGSLQGMTQDMYQALLEQGRMGMQAGQIRMGTGAPTQSGGWQSALGGALQGFGQGILANPGSLFGGGGGYDPSAARNATYVPQIQGVLSQAYQPIAAPTPTFTGTMPYIGQPYKG